MKIIIRRETKREMIERYSQLKELGNAYIVGDIGHEDFLKIAKNLTDGKEELELFLANMQKEKISYSEK